MYASDLRSAGGALLNILLGALVFGCVVFLAIRLGELLARRHATAEAAGRPARETLRVALSASGALAGGILFATGATLSTILIVASLCAALCATTFVGSRDEPAPVLLVGATLAIVLGATLAARQVGPLISAVTASLPFLITFLIARRSGADWRDGLVAALGAATLGLAVGSVAIIVACIATALPRLRRPSGARPRSAPRFSPALGATFMLTLLVQLAIT